MPTPFYLVAGARPNFIKLAPLVHSLQTSGEIPFAIVHTGQHYDFGLSEVFFQNLRIPPPDFNLEVGSGTHGAQTARILERFEALLMEKPAKAVVVFGDVNSTLACSLAAAKLQIPVAHVEAGLRSFDRSMPEEINRIVTDSLSDLLLVSEPSGLTNLSREGVPSHKVHLVGNIMIDSLEQMLPLALARDTLDRYDLEPGNYALLTLHRPSNVDDPHQLLVLLQLFCELSEALPILFPIHPRTRQKVESIGFSTTSFPSFRIIEAVDYLDALHLQKYSRLILTDSGGMQEESTYLGIPCLTLRENTERPITVELGTSILVGNDPSRIQEGFYRALSGSWKQANAIPYWDGHTAERIAGILTRTFGG